MRNLVNGLEVIGKTKDSGYKNSFFLIKTPDGKFIQLTELLFQLVVSMKNENNLSSIAAEISEQQKKVISIQQIEFLIEKKLVPLGIINDSSNELYIPQTNTGLLGINYSTTLLSEKTVNIIARIFLSLFLPPILVIVLTGFLWLDYWLFTIH